ncbi:8442_t:CDS:2 [Diversispora eburnea]|uniref:8442_t:CDS:1 n=1 Tax=Diversispora eburnea TaxID=1213867 RepID=A0A9N9FDE1_9GLOM|nr:8442_t:CDS:2 [Diversispora eburnea]
MTQKFPKNYIPPKQGHVLFIPDPNIEIYAPDTDTLESIITSTITQDERRQIDSTIFLPLYDLIMPTHKPRRKKAPRSQNSFVIFRKNFQAKITHEKGPEYSAQLKIISKHAKVIWHSLDIEKKSIYGKIANIANKVHKTIWPNYSYQPNRKDYQRTAINFPTSPSNSFNSNEAKLSEYNIPLKASSLKSVCNLLVLDMFMNVWLTLEAG